MTEKEITDMEWYEQLVNSKVYKLAQRNLIRNNKVNKMKHGGVNFYEFDPIEVIIEGFKVVRKAQKTGHIHKL